MPSLYCSLKHAMYMATWVMTQDEAKEVAERQQALEAQLKELQAPGQERQQREQGASARQQVLSLARQVAAQEAQVGGCTSHL